MPSACTIIAANYGAFARVLADSFFAHHPGGSLTILLIDDEQRQLKPADARVDCRRLSDIGLDPIEIHRLAGIYDATELATAVKPMLLRRLLDEGRSEVIYLDPDIRVYDSLEEVASLARQHSVVLTPHTMEPVPKDGRQVEDLFILAAGVYNLGFIGVGQGSRPFLDWWWQSTRREGLIDVKRMMFTDQRWIDFAPALFAPYILKDPACNVAYWNLHARSVTRDGDRYLVDGAPLRFFHFSGFDVRKPWLLSRHQGERPRVLLSERPVLARICQEYAACLRQAGIDLTPRRYGWGAAAAGFELDSRMRRLYWDGLRAAELGKGTEPPNPFDTVNPEGFLAWLKAPAEGGPRRVSRYLYSIYSDRDDLRAAFPDIRGVVDAGRFAEWVRRFGAEEERVSEELLPPPEGGAPASVRAAPPALAEGLTFVGDFRSEMEIGEAARLLTRAADAAGIPHSTITCDDAVHRHHPFDERPAGAQPYDINILFINPDGTPRFARDAGPGFFARCYTVGYWFWEVAPLPVAMHQAFDHVDEVWAATEYMADIFRAAGRKPVFTVPVPVPVPAFSPEITRARIGLPSRFVFLMVFDFLSVVPRKNPLGLIEAFMSAFSPDEGPLLVLKSINGHLRLPALEQLRMAAAARPDITIIDGHYGVEEKDALVGACDCYVSLHRSEGLGLTLAEAMALGKPVIATGYSGNRHFMTPENSYLVDYTLTEVPAGCDPYPAGASWAEPHLDHAARLMREVYERPLDAARKARRGQTDILERHGVRVAAEALTRRVDEIRRDRRRTLVAPHGEMSLEIPPHSAAVAAIEALGPYLEQFGAPRLSAEGRPWPAVRLAAQRLLFRLIRPYWFQQRQFQEALIHALRSSVNTLAGDVAALNAAADAFRTRTDARLKELALARVETQTSIAALSERLMTAPDIDARELYLPLLKDRAPVLDIGCGRGGMLDLLRAARVPAVGIDLDGQMIGHCRANGHTVEQADALQFLQAQRHGSVGAIFSARLIEHLSDERLQQFFRLCRSRLEFGGLLIAETANPRGLPAIEPRVAPAASARAITPETAVAMCQRAGFERAHVLFPTGTGDLEADRHSQTRYAVVATAGTGD